MAASKGFIHCRGSSGPCDGFGSSVNKVAGQFPADQDRSRAFTAVFDFIDHPEKCVSFRVE
jgi:hypothetical protein